MAENQQQDVLGQVNLPLIVGTGIGLSVLALLLGQRRGTITEIPQPTIPPIPTTPPTDEVDENILPIPVIDPNPSKITFIVGDTITFNAENSTDKDGYIADEDIYWELLDSNGNVIQQQPNSPRYTVTFGLSGQYSIRLTVRDNRGGVSNATYSFIVKEPLKAGSVIKTYEGRFTPFRHRSATIESWDKLLKSIEIS